MIINNNIPAMNTHRQMGINQGNMQSSMEKLSSGMRINKAGDDAAGLAISEKMRAQINGLDQASRNAQDGISLIQTGEGALDETHSILQRMRELAVQSSNDTNVGVDRDEIQKEVDQLSAEITRIADTTEFNTQNLLGGEFEGKLQIGANSDQNIQLSIKDMSAAALGVEGNNGLVQEGVQGTTDLTVTDTALDTAVGAKFEVQKLGEAQTVGGIADVEFTLRDSDNNVVGVSADGETYSLVNTSTESLTNNLSDVTLGTKVDIDLSNDFSSVKSGEIEITANATGAIDVKADATLSDDPGIASGSYTVVDGTSVALPTNQDLALLDSNGEVAAYGETAGNTWVDTKGESLFGGAAVTLAADDEVVVGGDGIDVSSQASANRAISTINDAIESVSSQRSELGSFQNRLEHTISNLDNSSENLSAAESRIRDVDMAKEMMEMTKANVLSQASQSMLAQANQQPQSVLQLLG